MGELLLLALLQLGYMVELLGGLEGQLFIARCVWLP